ncbi:hypothetical protein ACJDT4_16975 [Clostridium neuense]|uniref:Uncharacterized protein n=1 Tax=Clostridium neuense TaxID=1728934 RepID=A0ABW8TIS8_9CLOT
MGLVQPTHIKWNRHTIDAAGDPITLINSPAIKAELEFSVGGTVGGGSNSIKFKNGKFEDATMQTALQTISAGLGSNGAVELTALLGKINENTELSIETAYTGNSITITIETEEKKEINIAETVTITEDLNIELSLDISDTGASIVQAANSAVNSIGEELNENPMLGILIIIAVIVVIMALGCTSLVETVLASSIAGVAAGAIFIINILSLLISKLKGSTD